MGGHENVGPGAKLPRQTSEPSDYCPFGLVNCPRRGGFRGQGVSNDSGVVKTGDF